MCERMEEKEGDRRRGRWEEVGDTGHRTGDVCLVEDTNNELQHHMSIM